MAGLGGGFVGAARTPVAMNATMAKYFVKCMLSGVAVEYVVEMKDMLDGWKKDGRRVILENLLIPVGSLSEVASNLHHVTEPLSQLLPIPVWYVQLSLGA